MASISGAVMKMQAEDDARILDATDAMVLLSTMLGAVTRPASERADRSTTNTELSKPTTEQRPPTKTTQSEKPEPQHFHEAEPVHLHPKPHTPVVKIPRPLVQRIVYPKPKPGKAPGEKRKVKLKDDLKRRSVRTWLNGKRNDDFDIETPEHMHEHFKAEQLRTGSNSPRKWRNPPGYEAQHPNGRSFDHYGDLPGTVLHWGTKEDNGKMQNTREREGVPKIRQR